MLNDVMTPKEVAKEAINANPTGLDPVFPTIRIINNFIVGSWTGRKSEFWNTAVRREMENYMTYFVRNPPEEGVNQFISNEIRDALAAYQAGGWDVSTKQDGAQVKLTFTLKGKK